MQLSIRYPTHFHNLQCMISKRYNHHFVFNAFNVNRDEIFFLHFEMQFLCQVSKFLTAFRIKTVFFGGKRISCIYEIYFTLKRRHFRQTIQFISLEMQVMILRVRFCNLPVYIFTITKGIDFSSFEYMNMTDFLKNIFGYRHQISIFIQYFERAVFIIIKKLADEIKSVQS